jgi:hypothetical protein
MMKWIRLAEVLRRAAARPPSASSGPENVRDRRRRTRLAPILSPRISRGASALELEQPNIDRGNQIRLRQRMVVRDDIPALPEDVCEIEHGENNT